MDNRDKNQIKNSERRWYLEGELLVLHREAVQVFALLAVKWKGKVEIPFDQYFI